MNYEEKYKEALERAMKLAIDGYLDAIAINDIFPEPKESEDKRIKREIVAYINELADLKNEKIPTKWLAWLEKQGVQKNTSKREIDDAYLQGICDAKNVIEKQGKTLDADKVIEWLKHRELSCDDVVITVIPDDSPTSVPHRVKWLSDEFIKQFKKDFDL